MASNFLRVKCLLRKKATEITRNISKIVGNISCSENDHELDSVEQPIIAIHGMKLAISWKIAVTIEIAIEHAEVSYYAASLERWKTVDKLCFGFWWLVFCGLRVRVKRAFIEYITYTTYKARPKARMFLKRIVLSAYSGEGSGEIAARLVLELFLLKSSSFVGINYFGHRY